MHIAVFASSLWPRLARGLLLVALLAGLAVVAAPAAAAPVSPEHSDYARSDDVVFEGYCAFPVNIHLDQTGHQTLFYDENGVVRKIVAHITEQDTFSANGKTLVSRAYPLNFSLLFDSDGNLTHYVGTGQLIRLRLPDGSQFVGAGRVDWINHLDELFLFEADRGTPVDSGRFCAALAP